jgi:hypothetical protein
MSEIPVYIELDEELEEVLASGGYSIQDILAKEGIAGKVKYEAPPYQDETGARSKDLAITIMAGAAAVYLISKAITNVLRETHHKPIYDVFYELEPMLDGKGNAIKDPETGKPLMVQKVKPFVFEPGRTPGEEQSEVSAGLKGLVMKFSSKQQGAGK